ncbi:hypothetical protein HFO63_34605 [Rhizobium laguerreae]|jgi:hypothetical protein|uniref:hypothetical protein n=1 Tax=Rhizobium laguerreae TaxID=1076926 RepID=UPI001C901B2A|nr:hypothetical protein [Rhizobium laguerreae]MBY3088911.1 hypothetical protein [Rhizobium laguerreae]MBY3150619.1 hypothetical protein [Rhizobium laguerreae]
MSMNLSMTPKRQAALFVRMKFQQLCFGIRDGSTSNGYQKRGRKPGKRKDFMSDPDIIAKRQKALARMEAAE